MKKVLLAYFSATGSTEKMAQYIAEGVRFSGQEAIVKKMEEINAPSQIANYDGFIFGSPTYSLDVPVPVNNFLLLAEKAGLKGKLAGTFGSYLYDVSYSHDKHAPAIVLNILENDYKMKAFELGALILKENLLEDNEGMKACQDYGKVFAEKLGRMSNM